MGGVRVRRWAVSNGVAIDRRLLRHGYANVRRQPAAAALQRPRADAKESAEQQEAACTRRKRGLLSAFEVVVARRVARSTRFPHCATARTPANLSRPPMNGTPSRIGGWLLGRFLYTTRPTKVRTTKARVPTIASCTGESRALTPSRDFNAASTAIVKDRSKRFCRGGVLLVCGAADHKTLAR